MWFNPAELSKIQTTPLANPANYEPDIGETKSTISRISRISRISSTLASEKPVNCGQCLHFKSYSLHGKGSGICTNSGDYGSWSETQHQCAKFDAAVEWLELPEPSPGALIVTCYTPNGKAIEVESTSPEHAEILQRMNPKRPENGE